MSSSSNSLPSDSSFVDKSPSLSLSIERKLSSTKSRKDIQFFRNSAKFGINEPENLKNDLFNSSFKEIIIKRSPNPVKDKYKCIVLGDSGVGKTCLIERLSGREFPKSSVTTNGVHFAKIKRELDNRSIDLNIWDTSGQEKFHALLPLYYRGAHAVILVYDISKEKSFKNLHKWLNKLMKWCDQTTFVILLGNKSDKQVERQVNFNTGKSLMDNKEIIKVFKEISAEFDDNLEEILNDIFQNLLDIIPEVQNQQSIDLDKDGEEIRQENKKKCC